MAKEATSKVARKASKALAKGVRKGVGKAAKFIAKKAAKLVAEMVKLLIKLIIKLIAALGVWGILVLLIFLILFVIVDLTVNSRGAQKSYQLESAEQSNPVRKIESDLGDYYVAEGLSRNNKLILAFYTYFSQDSYSILLDDDTTLYKPMDDAIVNNNIKDKYSRESAFELNVNTLWALDEFLNNGDFRFPEQFVQAVPYSYENGELTLTPLTENGILTILSQAYDPYTKLPDSDNKELGLWDYGFGSVIHYSKYEEWEKGSGSLYSYEIYEPETDEIVTIILSPAEREAAETREQMVIAPHEVWLIDKAVGPFGHINAAVDYGERQTDRVWVYVEEITQTISIPVECPAMDEDKENEASNNEDTTVDDDTNEGSKCYEEFEVTLKYTYQGFITEKTAIFGDTDYSGLSGIQYYKDYFHNYHIKIPPDLMKSFDYEGRTGESESALLRLLDSDDPDNPSGEGIYSGDTEIGVGTNSESQNVANATQHIALFQKYGEMYGIDPYLLIAKAAQESGGLHDKYTPPRHNGPAIGIMQIEQPGAVIKQATAYNHITSQTETVAVCSLGTSLPAGCLDVSNFENNIRVGAMIMSGRARDNHYNLLVALQAYNFGNGGINATIRKYLESKSESADSSAIETVKKDINNTGWLDYRRWVHENPHLWLTGWQYDTYGDALYIEHVLRYYSVNLGGTPWVKDELGNLYTIGEGVIIGGSGLGSSNSNTSIFSGFISSLKNLWNSFIESFSDLFPSHKTDFPPERWDYYNYKSQHRETNEILATILTFNEGKMLLYYGEITDELWIENFRYLFSNAMAEAVRGISRNNNAVSIGLTIFPDGFTAPLDNMDSIVRRFGLDNDGILHAGIDIGAVLNSNVYSVALGEVIDISSSTEGLAVTIQHSNNVITKYANLSRVEVAIGTIVTKGQLIGKTGSNGEPGLTGLHFEIIRNGECVDPSFLLMQGGVSSGVPPQYMQSEIDAIFAEAERHIGKSYVWGGQGPNVFDCSGYISYIFSQLGYLSERKTVVSLESYALKNMEGSVYVFNNWDLLQPGDIITQIGSTTRHVILFAGLNDDGTYTYIDAQGSGTTIQYRTGSGFSNFAYGIRFRTR